MNSHRFDKISAVLGKLGAAGAFCAALFATSASATPVLDRYNAVTADAAAPLCSGSCNWQQSIVAGRSGQLTGITLYGMGTGELRIGFGEDFITGPWLADVQLANVNGTVIDLRSYNIFVTAGQTFVADVNNVSDSIFATDNKFGDKLWFSNADWGLEGIAYDPALALAYTTYIDSGTAADVPEPAALGLMMLGLLALRARRKT